MEGHERRFGHIHVKPIGIPNGLVERALNWRSSS